MYNKEEKTQAKEYTDDLQKLFLEIMLDHPESYVRVQNIFDSKNFARSLQPAATFIKEHTEKYKAMPTIEQINASVGTTLKPTKDLTEEHTDWFLEEFEGFSQSKALERAILKAADYLEKGNRAPIEKLIKDAVQIGLVKDIGTDYFADPRARLMAIKSGNGQFSTGWPALDKALFGGMNRGELNIFAGGSGSGKSLFMQNISVNWITAGLNGIYLTLELSEGLCSMRIDSMIANVSTRELFKNLDDVELKVRMAAKKSGAFQIKYMPAQSNVNDIRAYIREFQIQTGKKVDFLMVDYLDLLMPVSAKVSPNDLFVKDKYVSEELRNLSRELNILFITASQLNRCLALDTKVIANGNILNIRDVKVGDKLDSDSGPVEVYEVLPITKQPVYEIKLKSGKTIKCSAKHKFPTPNGLRTIENGLSAGEKLYIRSVEENPASSNSNSKSK